MRLNGFQEETLAGPFTPVVLAVAAAAATSAVVAGVVLGPTVMACLERGDFGQCIGEAYFGARPALVEAAPDAAGPAPAVAPEPDAPAVSQEAAGPAAPAFAVVRVEPDGSAVIAGSASPSSEVRIFANDDLLGSETTATTGDFAHVTASPLPTGGVELRLLDVATGQYASTSVVVIVPEDRSDEPIVVASEAGRASEILQGLAPEPARTPQEALEAIDLPLIEIAEPSPGGIEGPVADAEEPAGIAPVAAGDEPVVTVPDANETPAPVAEEIAAEEPVARIAEEPVLDEPVVEVPPATPPVDGSVPGTAVVPEVQAPSNDPGATAGEELAIAATVDQLEGAAPAPTAVIVPPTIDAVEIDGDRNFFAGSGTDGLSVRLYVDNQPVGSTDVRDGRWLIEAIDTLTAASQRIRVDMLDAQGAVAARAEVDFVLDLPAPASDREPEAQPSRVAERPDAASDADVPDEASPAATVQPHAGTAPNEGSAAQGASGVAGETPGHAVPTLVGTTTGDRTTSGRVIIRRGDNLWTIARRVYGEGLRYTQIYEANANSIRDPDLIYPGQVFGLPGTDVVIGED